MTPPTPTLLDLLVLVLAAYRLYRLAAWDSITEPLRIWVLGETDAGERVHQRPVWVRTWLDGLVGCPFCLGWWISLALALAWWWEPEWTLLACLPWAVSAGAALVATRLDPA